MKKDIVLSSNNEAKLLYGSHDENLNLIEREFDIQIYARGQTLTIEGSKEAIQQAETVIRELLITIRKGGQIKKHEVLYAVKSIKEKVTDDIHSIYLDRIEVSSKRMYVTPKSKGQKKYVDAIRHNDIVFGIGPAGTGKTYLAMAMAVNALKKQIVSRIILARPAVEAGESLGYLPGDLYEKVNPYLRPLYDALYDMMEVNKVQDYLSRGIIEVVPIAYMRGRTLNNAFIILDEAQNSTREQMKMFLTRLGFDSKAVITGDITQSDLPKGKEGGLKEVINILKGINGINFSFLSGEDVVRHELVQDIIRAYEKYQDPDER
ncbi:MAG: PhoH family protein [Candidatus Omnitrophica bacterium]|nr:PhoH family protein [Candidatus Omnitrophota bacterium]